MTLRNILLSNNRHMKHALLSKKTISAIVSVWIIIIYMVLISSRGWSNQSYFSPGFTLEQKDTILRTFKVLTDTLKVANITYFNYGGSLIGSFRHHGLIPWDDDIDIIVNNSQKMTLIKTLRFLEPRYKLYMKKSSIGKFYATSEDTEHHLSHNFKWPYIDILFFVENETHIWDDYFTKNYVFPKNMVFPLVMRPFEDFFQPAPFDTRSFLEKTYGKLSICVSRKHSHKYDISILPLWKRTLPCEDLKNIYPFVDRVVHTNGSVDETLRIGETSIKYYSCLHNQGCKIK